MTSLALRQDGRVPTLVLLRHAKAEPHRTADLTRELAPAGRADAAAAGRWLVEHGLFADRVVVSPARRTRQTWELAGTLTPQIDDRVYDAAVSDLQRVLAATPPEVRVLVLVGHDPGLSELLGVLAPRDAVRMRTCAVAVLELDDWCAERAELTALAVPRG